MRKKIVQETHYYTENYLRTMIEYVTNITLMVTETLHVSTGPGSEKRAVAKFCLLLSGKTLHISALLAAKRFSGQRQQRWCCENNYQPYQV